MKILIVIIIAVPVAILIFFIMKSIQGVRYWNRCEKEYDSMMARDYSNEEALLEISKKRYPELSENTHIEFIDKFNELGLLVNFFTGALPDGKQNDKIALELLRDTTIQYQGPGRYKVRTKRTKEQG